MSLQDLRMCLAYTHCRLGHSVTTRRKPLSNSATVVMLLSLTPDIAMLASEEVRHYHVHYTLMNFPRTKNNRHSSRKRCAAKIKMGLGGFRDAESVSPVRSNIACLCDLQTAFMWLLRAR